MLSKDSLRCSRKIDLSCCIVKHLITLDSLKVCDIDHATCISLEVVLSWS